MRVFDASSVTEALIGQAPHPELLRAMEGEVSAPHHVDVEVLSAIRGRRFARKLDETTCDSARLLLGELVIERYATAAFAERIWQLRHNFTSYDAAYIALAEALDAPLITCDAKLDSGLHHAEVRVFPRSH